MTKAEVMKKVEELKKQGKQPHGYLRDLLIEYQLSATEREDD